MTNSKPQSDLRQLNVRSAIDGEQRGILLDVSNPKMEIFNQVVILWGGEVNLGRTTSGN